MSRRIAALSVALGLVAAAPAAAATGGFVTAPGGPALRDSAGRVLQLHGVNLGPSCRSDTHPAAAAGTPCIPGADPRGPQPDQVLLPTAVDPGRRLTDADAATLARLGFTSVRLSLHWDSLEPGDPSVKPNDPRFCSPHVAGTPYPDLGSADPWRPAVADAYLSKVDVAVKLLERHGVRVLLYMDDGAWGPVFNHPTGTTPWMGQGAPAWATCTDGQSTDSTYPAWTSAETLDGAILGAYSHFWANDVSANLQAHFDRALAHAARFFKDDPGVLGYEVYNEPVDQTAVFPPEMDRKLECFYAGSDYAPNACRAAVYPAPMQALPRGAVPQVEVADPNHLVFVETHTLANDGVPTTLGASGELPFPRLVFSVHVYPPETQLGGLNGGDGYTCSSPACQAEDARIVSQYAADRAAMRTAQPGGPAWYMTEFGAHPYAPDLDHVAGDVEAYGLGWMYWAGMQLHDPTGAPHEGMIDEATRHPDPARAAVLARTYPLATAGTPLAQRFDPPSGQFDFTYRPDPAIAAPTEIVVPTSVHYPHGYDATVTGGRVTSPAGASRLTVKADPGASLVRVHVTARPA